MFLLWIKLSHLAKLWKDLQSQKNRIETFYCLSKVDQWPLSCSNKKNIYQNPPKCSQDFDFVFHLLFPAKTNTMELFISSSDELIHNFNLASSPLPNFSIASIFFFLRKQQIGLKITKIPLEKSSFQAKCYKVLIKKITKP